MGDPKPERLVIIKVPTSHDVMPMISSISQALSKRFETEVRVDAEIDGEHWLVKTRNQHFLSAWEQRIKEQKGVPTPYEVEIIPTYTEVLQHLRGREWWNDYRCRNGARGPRILGRGIDKFAVIREDRSQRWAKIDGIVGWLWRFAGKLKRCCFCETTLDTPYIKLRDGYQDYLVCGDLTACDEREKESRERWNAHRAEGIQL